MKTIEVLFEELTGINWTDTHVRKTNFARWIGFSLNSLPELMAVAAEYNMEEELFYLVPDLLPSEEYKLDKNIFGNEYNSLLASAMERLRLAIQDGYDCGDDGDFHIVDVLHEPPTPYGGDGYYDALADQCTRVSEHISSLEQEVFKALETGKSTKSIATEISIGDYYLDLLKKIADIFAVPKYRDYNEAHALISS